MDYLKYVLNSERNEEFEGFLQFTNFYLSDVTRNCQRAMEIVFQYSSLKFTCIGGMQQKKKILERKVGFCQTYLLC